MSIPHRMHAVFVMLPTVCSLSIVQRRPWEASQRMKDWRGIWPSNHSKWWMIFAGLVSRSNSQAESMVNCPEGFPFQTWRSSMWGPGWKGIEFQIAWKAWILLGKFQPSSLMIPETFAFQSNLVSESSEGEHVIYPFPIWKPVIKPKIGCIPIANAWRKFSSAPVPTLKNLPPRPRGVGGDVKLPEGSPSK